MAKKQKEVTTFDVQVAELFVTIRKLVLRQMMKLTMSL